MEVYTVKQVADMLHINPETIRRWIRQKKLIAIQDSRKDGNVITEDSLKSFLKSMPKYASVAAGAATIGLASPLGLPLIASGIFSALSKKSNEKLDNSLIFAEDLEKYLKSEIEFHKTNIKIKETNIEQLKLEIESEQKKINEIRELISSNKKKGKK